jgi:ABC-type transport system substrate-binding protein
LAESWTVSPDGKVYTFKIRQNYSAAGLMATIQNTKNDWTNVHIAAPDDATLVFTLPEPLGIFLGSTTQALFPFGPYEVVKRDKNEVVLRANQQFVLQQPYLQKVVIKLYSSNDSLAKAASDGEIQGSADFTSDVPKKFTEYKASLPRYYVLFFNTTRPAFKKSEDRARIIEKKDGPPVTYTLITSQSGYASELGDQLKSQLASHGVTLDLQKKNSIALQREELAKRDFDLLLYGIDYGIDRDYYPFWHSSQVATPGLNLSGIKDKDLDKLLESARREQNPIEREKIIQQIETYLKDKSLQTVLEQEVAKFWVSSEIKGVQYATIDESVDRYNLVWRWYSKSHLVKPSS